LFGEFLNKPFKIYASFLILFAVMGLMNNQSFKGNRIVASSDCADIAKAIIRLDIPVAGTVGEKEALELKHYRFRNSIWSKILRTREFEHFDENEYFRLLEIYKEFKTPQNNLLEINPVSIEQKLALIEAIQIKFAHFQNTPFIQDEIQKLSAYKLKKLQQLMKKFDLSSKVTRANLQDFSSDFFLILKGPPISVLDYFAKNKTALMNKRMIRVLQEEMLIKGLKGTLERIPVEENITQLEKARFFVKKVMKYKVWRFMIIPYDLPWIDRVKISDELLEKILLDGLDEHESELIAELTRQNLIDHYERFRKAYRPVAFGVGFYYYYENSQKKLDENEEKSDEIAKKKFIEDFKKLSDAITSGDTIEKTDEEIKEIQFQRVLKSFKERYHEDPTASEYKELHQKIFGPN
jgi:hypothetical protein